MGIADGMKSITEGIIASHEARMKGARERRSEVNELVDNAQKTVRHFANERKHMGAGQAKALADYVETLKTDVGGMIKGFQKDHAAVAAGIREKAEALRETLATGEADRMKSFKGMMADTREVIKGVEKSVKDIKTYVADKMSAFSG